MRDPRQNGSILVMVLLMCLAIAVVIQTLAAVVICAERAFVDESTGRLRMAEKDAGLGALRTAALATWDVIPWSTVYTGPEAVEGRLTPAIDNVHWIAEAEVRQEPAASRLMTSVWIERGRDGVDLPMAALVGYSISRPTGRTAAWLEADSVGLGAVACLCRLPPDPLLGEGCYLQEMAGAWSLDVGWERFFADGGSDGLAPGPSVAALTGWHGMIVDVPAGGAGGAADNPLLVVVTGGADLDARGMGDLYGVIVVDEGSVYLDGTTVHGAVFVTETVDFGETGGVVFSKTILRWATDRSLVRTRLVPGSRWEGTE